MNAIETEGYEKAISDIDDLNVNQKRLFSIAAQHSPHNKYINDDLSFNNKVIKSIKQYRVIYYYLKYNEINSFIKFLNNVPEYTSLTLEPLTVQEESVMEKFFKVNTMHCLSLLKYDITSDQYDSNKFTYMNMFLDIIRQLNYMVHDISILGIDSTTNDILIHIHEFLTLARSVGDGVYFRKVLLDVNEFERIFDNISFHVYDDILHFTNNLIQV